MYRLFMLVAVLGTLFARVPQSMGGDGTLPIRWVGFFMESGRESHLMMDEFSVSDKENPLLTCANDDLGAAYIASGSVSIGTGINELDGHVVGACESSDGKMLEVFIDYGAGVTTMVGTLKEHDGRITFTGTFDGSDFSLYGDVDQGF